MIGHNVIGKIYRSKKMISLTNGYILKTKYKSNFGGTYDLVLSFKTDENGAIIIGTNKDLLLDTSTLNKENIELDTDKILINKNSDYYVNFIIKPDVYNKQKTTGIEILSKTINDGLYIPLIIEINKKYNVLDMYLITSIYDNKEYIEVKIENVIDEKIIIKTAKESII